MYTYIMLVNIFDFLFFFFNSNLLSTMNTNLMTMYNYKTARSNL